MLHDILLSLSGHPSALFDAGHHNANHVTSSPVALLSPPEAELLSSLAHLSRLHRRTRDHVNRISAAHPAVICRAVATAISSHHLEQFQRNILHVESSILKRDASTVGAYNIVPLAGIVNEFSGWTKLMEWLWYISNFMLESERANSSNSSATSGAELIDKLRIEAQTGYPDIEEAALHLGKVAEASWLRQLSTWLLYGRLPSFGASDFFIESDAGDGTLFNANSKLLPKFVTRQTASSVVFIGRSLNQIRSLQSSSTAPNGPLTRASELELLPKHIEYLSQVAVPISTAKLSEVVSNIRLSLSRNLLQHFLPLEKIVEILTVLHQFFLLGRGEFPVALIAEADEKIQSRHRSPLQSDSGPGIKGVLLRENEINSVLAKSFSVLSTLGGDDDHTDDILDLATGLVHLIAQPAVTNRPGTPGRAREASALLFSIANVPFNDLLLSTSTSLTMDIRSPLDLFITKPDLETYSSVNAYLLAVRRAHLHLSQLWRNSSVRREYPAPPTYHFSNSTHGRAILGRRRQRNDMRGREMRKVWATCAAAVFLLSESEAYFQGEVVQESVKHFLRWISSPLNNHDTATTTQEPPPSVSFATSGISSKPATTGAQHHDSEALSFAHRQFLNSISYSLLLTDVAFTKATRGLFGHVDELVALVNRLQIIRQNLDLEEDDGVEDFTKNYRQEEADVSRELDRARRRLDSDMKSIIARLREIDTERGGAGPALVGLGTQAGSDYEPLRVGGIDRLLMKLDWGGASEEDEDI
ncbi:hypothetical protein EJ04DRAFT_458307 [Polyplosphaeria fusca]|uniref:Spindle pole body component n=1 Tax=Polyplosphaeria fusca TaxID=682080 RepID=A0A9P4V761_9PLEO|nr:hypothetical protein EJ04DRAFT_458307 [Polyplosphaeria fusca]